MFYRSTWGSSFKASKSKSSINGADLKLEDNKVHGLVYRVTSKHKAKARNLSRAISVQVTTSGFLFTTTRVNILYIYIIIIQYWYFFFS